MNNILLGSGLSSLGFLSSVKNKNNWICYDKNEYHGGHAYSHNFFGDYYDEGAHIFHSKNEFVKNYFKVNEIDNYLIKSDVVNFYKSKKIGYPVQLNLYDLELKEKIFFLIDFFSRKHSKNENYYDWLINNYGNFLTETFYRKYTEKYWRTDPEEMSNDWVTKRLVEKNLVNTIKSIFFKSNKSNAVFNYFMYPKKNGFFNIFKKEYENKKILLNKKITKIDLKNKNIIINNSEQIKYDNLVSSIPLVDYLSLIDDMPADIVTALKNLKYTTLISYNIKIKKRLDHKFHWCYFYDKSVPFSRMTILSNLKDKKSSKDYFLVQGEVFRRNDEYYNCLEIDQDVRKHLIKFFQLKTDNDIIFNERKIIDKAYPVPLINTKENVKKILNWVEKFNIKQIGLYGKWNYLWSDQSFIDGWNEGVKINEIQK